MNEVSTLRLYVLRALYLLIVIGLAVIVWPGIIYHDKPWGLAQGTVICMLAAFSLLCALGLRYPLQMLPVLLWEVLWKTIWLLMVPLPAWLNGQFSPAIAAQTFEVGMVILVYAAIPWGYVYRHYLAKAGDSWRGLDRPKTSQANPAT